jgi:hypothetical protein
VLKGKITQSKRPMLRDDIAKPDIILKDLDCFISSRVVVCIIIKYLIIKTDESIDLLLNYNRN